jgi:hypothetical protein
MGKLTEKNVRSTFRVVKWLKRAPVYIVQERVLGSYDWFDVGNFETEAEARAEIETRISELNLEG